jgi:4-hydroxybenzoate polyprenyltransferase
MARSLCPNAAMEKFRAILALLRWHQPAGYWLLFWPGAWSITLASAPAAPPAYLLALFFLGAICMRSAGCIVNDAWDRDIDKQVARTRERPLASGALTLREAAIMLFVLLALSLWIALQLPRSVLWLAFASLPLVALYPLMKRFTWWPQLFLGLTFNFGALMGWAAIRGTLDAPAWLLYIAGIFWTLGYDTLYALQDIKDDTRIGVKSSARRLGRYATHGVALFYSLMAGFILLACYVAKLPFYTILALVPALFHLGWQIHQQAYNPKVSAAILFRSNSLLGLLVFGALLTASL